MTISLANFTEKKIEKTISQTISEAIYSKDFTVREINK